MVIYNTPVEYYPLDPRFRGDDIKARKKLKILVIPAKAGIQSFNKFRMNMQLELSG